MRTRISVTNFLVSYNLTRFSPGPYISLMAGMSFGCRFGVCCSAGRQGGVDSPSNGKIVIRRASKELELRQVAQLRADAYYEVGVALVVVFVFLVALVLEDHRALYLIHVFQN